MFKDNHSNPSPISQCVPKIVECENALGSDDASHFFLDCLQAVSGDIAAILQPDEFPFAPQVGEHFLDVRFLVFHAMELPERIGAERRKP